MCFSCEIFRLVKVILCLSLFASQALATPEDICPGGSSPRSDIVMCADMDNLGLCITGLEPACYAANSLSYGSGSFKILPCDITAAGGAGCIRGTRSAGGSSFGYATYSVPATDAGCSRFYFRLGPGFIPSSWNSGGHFPSLDFTNGSGCTGSIKTELWAGGINPGLSAAGTSNGGACGAVGSPGSWESSPNIENTWRPHNNRWYLVEQCVVLNTTASGPGKTQGNGRYTVYIDEVKRYEETNLNFRGSSTTAKITGGFGPRLYYGNGSPEFNPDIYFDQFAFSNNATLIGRDSGENALGTPDAIGPYSNILSYQAWTNPPQRTDCVPSGLDGVSVFSNQWQAGSPYALVSNPTNNSYVNTCATNGSMRALTSSAGTGSGIYYEVNGSFVNRWALHDHVYLYSGNDYSANTPVLGFLKYGSSSTSNAFGLLRNAAGNWARLIRINGVDTVVDLGVAATLDTWSEVELHITSTGAVSIWINGVWVQDEVATSIAWGVPDKIVVGTMFNSPATPFAIYHDDTDIRSVSAVDCKGWSAASCPFAAPTPTPTPTPTGTIAPTATPTNTPTPTATATPTPVGTAVGACGSLNKLLRGRK